MVLPPGTRGDACDSSTDMDTMSTDLTPQSTLRTGRYPRSPRRLAPRSHPRTDRSPRSPCLRSPRVAGHCSGAPCDNVICMFFVDIATFAFLDIMCCHLTSCAVARHSVASLDIECCHLTSCEQSSHVTGGFDDGALSLFIQQSQLCCGEKLRSGWSFGRS